MSRSQSLSTIDSVTASDSFDSMYLMLDRLKAETTSVRDNLKSCSRRIADVDLSEYLLEPRPHAVAWFKSRKMATPCDLEEFLGKVFQELGAKRRVCHRTRTIILDQESAALFQLEANFAYRWVEVLQKLPCIFY